MQVVQHDDEPGSADRPQVRQQVGCRAVEPEPVERAARRRGLDSGDAAQDRRGRVGQLRGAAQGPRVEVGEGVRERLERGVLFVLGGPAAQDRQPPAAGPQAELVQQPALADARPPGDVDDGRSALAQPVDHRVELPDLSGPADERRSPRPPFRLLVRPVFHLGHRAPPPEQCTAMII